MGLIKKPSKSTSLALLLSSSLLSGCAVPKQAINIVAPTVERINPKDMDSSVPSEDARNYCQSTPENAAEYPIKESSDLEKILVDGSGLYVYIENPQLALTVLPHELAHSLAAVLTGAGVKKFSIFPPKRSDESIQRGLADYNWLGICNDPRDYSSMALALNVSESISRIRTLSGKLAYMVPNKEPEEMTLFQNLAINLAPYVLDGVFIYVLRDSKSLFVQMQLGSKISTATGGAILGLTKEQGDFANVARVILPPERFNEIYFSILRRSIAGAVGYLIAKKECDIMDFVCNPPIIYKHGLLPPF